MSRNRFIVKNIKLPIELNARLERFKITYKEMILKEMGYSITHTDVIRYVIMKGLDVLEKKFEIDSA